MEPKTRLISTKQHIAFSFPLAPGQEGDIQDAASAIRGARTSFERGRGDLGLISLTAGIQKLPAGHAIVVTMEGDLHRYFAATRTEGGVDTWFREKMRQWTGSNAVVAAFYDYPQSELLFEWRADDGG